MSAWDGDFTLTCMSNIAHAQEEFDELDSLVRAMDDERREQYRALPPSARMAIDVAWVRAKRSVAMHQDCLASFCEPWFDGSAYRG